MWKRRGPIVKWIALPINNRRSDAIDVMPVEPGLWKQQMPACTDKFVTGSEAVPVDPQ